MAESIEATLFKDVTIITVDAYRRVILNGYILVQDSLIVHVSSQAPEQIPENTRILSLPGRIIIPGLINAHAHLAQSLLRGLAEDLPLHSWLCDRIWPLEAAYAGEGESSDGYIAARLTIAEMLLSGTTCFLEAMLTDGSGIDNVARAVREMGIRACLGGLVRITGLGLGRKRQIPDPRDSFLHDLSLAALLKAHAKHHGSSDGLIHVWAALGTPRGAPETAFANVGRTCAARGLRLTMHCAEARDDVAISRAAYGGRSPVMVSVAAEVAGPRRVLAHACHLDDADVRMLAGTRTAVAHCPTSNLKLASGVAPVAALRAAGAIVALGSDGAPCNNSYDMLREMHLASVLHKGVFEDASAIGAHEALEMATVEGARALSLEQEVGSLEVGKKADLVVLDIRRSWAAPWDPETVAGGGGMDPVSLVVGCCTGRDVSHVMVNGRMLVQEGVLLCADEEAITQAARKAVRGIRERSGIQASRKPGWNYE
ncbi:hypothetical protein F4779DRAFT_492087 [Xylariaceae sp. FL0662B]|nr:hypothetical protein F4779DRAFT_492087 [Xylariaceae sp. FL0662B]